MRRVPFGFACALALLGLFVVMHLPSPSGAAVGFGISAVLAQEAEPIADSGEAPAPARDSERVTTLWDMIEVGGLIMIPIALCSVWMIALLAELFLKLREKVACPPETVEQLQSQLGTEDYAAAWQTSWDSPSVLSHVMRRALKKLPKGQDAVEDAAGEALLDENNVLKTKISYLGVIAGVSPMLGLLGTISGMIKAFNKMGHEGAIGDPAKLAGDIGEALVTTFAGLLVAIPAMIVFYIMTNRSKKILTLVQERFTELMEDVAYDQVPDDLVLEPAHAFAAATVAAAAPAPSPRAAGRGTISCPTCSKPVAVGAPTCPDCGQELDWN